MDGGDAGSQLEEMTSREEANETRKQEQGQIKKEWKFQETSVWL